MYNRAERFWIRSKNDKRISVPKELMSLEDSEAIGNYVLAIVLSEFNDLRERGAVTTVYSQECCTNHVLFDLPCRHLKLSNLIHQHLSFLPVTY